MKFSKIVLLVLIGLVFFQGLNTIFAGNYPAMEFTGQLDVDGGIDAFAWQDHGIFSNRTNLFYNFYWGDTGAQNNTVWGIRYDAVTVEGDTIHKGIPIFLQFDPELHGNQTDFSVTTDWTTEKVYLALCWDTALDDDIYAAKVQIYVYYMTVSEETKLLDILSVDTATHTEGPMPRWIDICVTRIGYPVLTYRWGGNGEIHISSSITNWVDGDAYSLETVFWFETGQNPPSAANLAPIAPIFDNGVALYYLIWDSAGLRVDHEILMVCSDVNANVGYVGADWVVGAWKQNQVRPNDYYWEVDIVNAFSDDNVFFVYPREVGTETRLYLQHYNGTDNSFDYDVLVVADYESDVTALVHIFANMRGNCSVIYTTDQSGYMVWNITKWNQTTEDWGDPAWLVNASTKINAPIRRAALGSYSPYFTESNATVAGLMWNASIDWGWFYLDNRTYIPSGGDLPPTIQNVSLVNSGGAAIEWIKEREVYHLVFDTNNTEWGYIEFTDNDDFYRFYFNETTNRVWFDQGNHEFKGTVIEFSRVNNSVTADHWDITFTLAQNIDDAIDIDFTYYVVNHWHNQTESGDFATGLNIYNLGGFTMGRVIQNDAGFNPVGNPLEVWSRYNAATSWAITSQVYRKIQLYHSQFALDVSDNVVFDTLENTGDLQIGWQYYNESSQAWYDLAWVNIDINTGAVDPAGAGNGKAWVNFQYAWYVRIDTGATALVKSGYFVGYPDCGDDVNADITTSQFWVDLWLDRANNSRVIGGNVNPYYYGMDETGWLFFNTWRPIMVNETFGEFQAPLRAYNGSIMQADEMDLMRITTTMITGGAADTNVWSIEAFKNQDIKLAEGRLIGIDKPAFVETLTIEMASTGFLSGLRKAIQNVGSAIGAGLAGIWKITIGAIDTILEFLGLPEGTFSSIMTVIKGLLGVVTVVLQNFDEMISHLVASISNYILLIVTTAGRIIFFADMLISTIIQFWQGLVSFFTGGWANVGEMWNSYNLVGFLQLWLVAFFPFWEIERISNSENPMGVVKDDVGFVIGILTAIIHAFGLMFSFVRDAFDFIVSLIP